VESKKIDLIEVDSRIVVSTGWENRGEEGGEVDQGVQVYCLMGGIS
jgi:hypothetical protein